MLVEVGPEYLQQQPQYVVQQPQQIVVAPEQQIVVQLPLTIPSCVGPHCLVSTMDNVTTLHSELDDPGQTSRGLLVISIRVCRCLCGRANINDIHPKSRERSD